MMLTSVMLSQCCSWVIFRCAAAIHMPSLSLWRCNLRASRLSHSAGAGGGGPGGFGSALHARRRARHLPQQPPTGRVCSFPGEHRDELYHWERTQCSVGRQRPSFLLQDVDHLLAALHATGSETVPRPSWPFREVDAGVGGGVGDGMLTLRAALTSCYDIRCRPAPLCRCCCQQCCIAAVNTAVKPYT